METGFTCFTASPIVIWGLGWAICGHGARRRVGVESASNAGSRCAARGWTGLPPAAVPCGHSRRGRPGKSGG
jgi:hypothetical protein